VPAFRHLAGDLLGLLLRRRVDVTQHEPGLDGETLPGVDHPLDVVVPEAVLQL
jgi:hypothetical protein